MSKDPKVISYLNIQLEQHFMYPIDKSANNIAFICKKYYAQVLLKITFVKYYIKHLSTSEWYSS